MVLGELFDVLYGITWDPKRVARTDLLIRPLRSEAEPGRALRRRVDGLVRWIKSALLTVLLNTRRAQAGKPCWSMEYCQERNSSTVSV